MPLLLRRTPEVDPNSYGLFCGVSQFAWIKILGGGGPTSRQWSWHTQWGHVPGIRDALGSERHDGYDTPEAAAAAAARACRRAIHALGLMEVDPPKL